MKSVSVIIPVYNVEQYLEECILSITKELKSCDELILINDGSNDGSLDMCRKYEAANVYVINNTNHGVSYSRNCGIMQASADYITFVDSDDYLIPGWRDIMEEGMSTGKDIVYFSEVSSDIPSKKDIVSNILCFPDKKTLSIKASACWYKIFRCEFIKQHNILFDCDVINGEDGLFCLEALLSSESYTLIKAPKFYYYRVNNSSATHRFNEKFNTSNLKYIKTVNESLTASGLFSEKEVKTYVDYVNSHGLYVLACRISRIESPDERRNKYRLFEQPEYIELYEKYVPDKYCSKRTKTVFKLLKAGEYERAIRNILIHRRLYRIIMKVMKKGNGI